MTDGARTHDHRNHNPGLYQLSYSHHNVAGANGAPGRSRTCDPRLRRPLLYPTELRAHSDPEKWSEWRDSNPRHSAPKADALPDCATLRLSHEYQLAPLEEVRILLTPPLCVNNFVKKNVSLFHWLSGASCLACKGGTSSIYMHA